MSAVWLAFAAGIVLGVPAGILIAGLCVSAARADEAMVLAAYERAVRRRHEQEGVVNTWNPRAHERERPELRN